MHLSTNSFRDGLNGCHQMVLDNQALTPEEGLLLGNGDLSVSVYQAQDEIRFRLGKGDVWDRRLDFSRDFKPAHIKEVAHGILEEGWKCGPYGGPVEATRQRGNEKRMKELCTGCPPSYKDYPFPAPKPVAELALRYCGDLLDLKIRQCLLIEEGRLEITCSWRGGTTLSVSCVVHPEENRLALKWRMDNPGYGGVFPGLPPSFPLWFALYRKPDETISSFADNYFATTRYEGFASYTQGGAKPLPPPEISDENGTPALVQNFPPDPLFKDGFSCVVMPLSEDLETKVVKGAVLQLLPKGIALLEGELTLVVRTSSALTEPWPGSSTFAIDRETAKVAAAAFWAKSAIALSEPVLEQLWYSTLHAKRCVLRAGKTPPGLFLPSTLRDHSHWHGDYHSNYNYQSLFLGDYAANHFDLGDAYFEGMKYFLAIGRKIARDYYGCRGVFIQLSGYPTHPQDDPLGAVPMGRMAYMTGWVASQYFSRWRHSLDKAWLETTGYPAVKDLALFFTDFLEKGADGLFHIFPSNQGEDGFTGDPKDYTDRPQVIHHARYALFCATEMAEALGIDPVLLAQWRELLKKLAPEDGDGTAQAKRLHYGRLSLLPPEFIDFVDDPTPPFDTSAPPLFLAKGHHTYDWYPGGIPYRWMSALRKGNFLPSRDLPLVTALIERWLHPNGLLCAMSIANYGRPGAWTETLGVLGPLQELLLQSWNGCLELFPGWPLERAASFSMLRAEGAFLVSATLSDGVLTSLSLVSERGSLCRIKSHVRLCFICDGKEVDAASGDGILSFPTRQGASYTLAKPVEL